MKKRFYLNITPAVIKLAKKRGALFDKEKNAWYVEGEVHTDLEDFLPAIIRVRDYCADPAPTCPKCATYTIKKENNLGDIFWICANYFTCKGQIPFVQNFRTSTSFLTQPPKKNNHSHDDMCNQMKNISSISIEVHEHVKSIVERAIKMHQSEFSAFKWLKTKKVGLQMKSPIEVMNSVSGCDTVARLLTQTFE